MLYLLDDTLGVLAIVEAYEKLVWQRRFDGGGRVEAVISGKLFSPASRARYLYRVSTAELALVEGVIRQRDGNLTLRGRGAEALLAGRVLIYDLPAEGETVQTLRNLIASHCMVGERRIPCFSLGAELAHSALFDGAAAGEDLLSLCLTRLNPLGIGLQIDAEGDEVVLSMRVGTDRSGHVVISNEFENLACLEYRRASGTRYNIAYVVGLDKNGEETVRTVDRRRADEARRECYVNARSVSWSYKNEAGEKVERTSAEYEAILTRMGEEACRGEALILYADVKPDGLYRYRADYEVGDLISVLDTQTGVGGVFRVMGAEEVILAGKTTLTLDLREVF